MLAPPIHGERLASPLTRRLLLVLVFIGCALLPAVARAESFHFGSPLAAPANLALGCETQPTISDTSGALVLVPSNQPDCTWRQGGVPGAAASDTRYSSVPADGWIVQADVKAGPAPAPVRFVILRQIETVCCYFVRETGLVGLKPNSVTSVALNLPVERNSKGGVQVYDLVAVSAPAATGSLPLSSNGHNNAFQETEPGNPVAGFWYPRMGNMPGDAGGGRRESGYPGVELLVRWTFCAYADTCGSAGGAGPAVAPSRKLGAGFALAGAVFDRSLQIAPL